MKMIKLLIIGEVPPPLSGVTVLVKLLLDELESRDGVETLHLDSSTRLKFRSGVMAAFNHPLALLSVIVLFVRSIFMIPRVDIVTLHSVTPKIAIHGVIVLLLCMIFRKTFIIRKFGGTDFYQYSSMRSAVTNYVVKNCDCYMAETKELVNIAKANGIENCRWMPNHRRFENSKLKIAESCRKFVFIARVCKEKGVGELCEAFRGLEKDSVSLDVYGPLSAGYNEEYFKRYGATYKGVLQPEDVVGVLEKYDVLVLPSYHLGEGYPGSIIEAYSIGKPVIVTRWRALPEIVDESSGILVAPKSVEELSSAMNNISEDMELYKRLCSGAYEKGRFFAANYWVERFIEICLETYKIKISEEP